MKSLSYKNVFLKKFIQGFYKEWQRVMDELHVQSRGNKKTNVLDGMIITSDKAFLKKRYVFSKRTGTHKAKAVRRSRCVCKCAFIPSGIKEVPASSCASDLSRTEICFFDCQTGRN